MRDIKTYSVDVQTLTYLHIGDGAQLTSSEWTTYCDNGDLYIAVVDPEKVLKIIGKNRMGQYVSAIDNGDNIADFMKRCVSGTPVTKYMRRSMLVVKGAPKKESTIKTCIHDGMGHPYLPGSSVKGAVRTALLDYLLRGSDIYQRPTSEIKPNLVGDYEKRYLGSMEKDVFHFVRFFDARFERETEVAFSEYNLNIRNSIDSLIDTSKSAWVEAVDVEQDASMRLQIDVGGLAASHYTQAAAGLMSAQKLFGIINKHTMALLKEDIDIWNGESNNGKDGADAYINNLRELLRQAKACGEGECVMRVGHGSGWRFTTGGWPEQFEDAQWNTVVNLSRPNNVSKYSNYRFPKSRRIGGFNDPLGFIKLKIKN